MRSSLAIVLLAALAGSCTGAPSTSPGAPVTTTPGAAAGGSPVVESPRLDYYEPLVRELVSFAGPRHARLAIRIEICRTATEPFTRREVCHDAFTELEQAALLTRLADVAGTVTFYRGQDGSPFGLGPGVAVWVGTPDPHGDRLWIGGGMTCGGGLCAQGGTYALRERGDRWVVDGLAPGAGAWIA